MLGAATIADINDYIKVRTVTHHRRNILIMPIIMLNGALRWITIYRFQLINFRQLTHPTILLHPTTHIPNRNPVSWFNAGTQKPGFFLYPTVGANGHSPLHIPNRNPVSWFNRNAPYYFFTTKTQRNTKIFCRGKAFRRINYC